MACNPNGGCLEETWSKVVHPRTYDTRYQMLMLPNKNRDNKMGIRLIGIVHAKQRLKSTISSKNSMVSTSTDVPKGHLAVYVGES
ncbi:unnamed protein product, partial [Ilex paraguariensis]